MKIGISSSTIDPNLNHGHVDGIGVYTQNLYKHFQAMNHTVVPTVYPPFRQKWNGASLPNSKTFSLPCSISSLTSVSPLYRVFNRKIEKQMDVFHATDHRIPRFKNVPVVATLHDAIMFKYPEWCNPRLRDYKNWLMKQSSRWADHYIAISQAMVSELVDFWGVDEKKISVVHNGVGEYWFDKVADDKKQAVLNKYSLQPGFMLFVGTLQPRKNIDRIIKAFKLLPEELKQQHKLVIVGRDGWQTQEMMIELQKLISDKHAVWLQYISNDELRTLYQSAKLFLFPSLSEGFGIPILEAFASRVPLLTSTVTSMPEIAGDAACLVDPFSVEAIHQGMVKLLSDQDYCDELVARGSVRVKDFGWEKCARETLQVYKNLL